MFALSCFAAVLLGAAACEREDRELRSPPSGAKTVSGVQLSTLVPGMIEPTTQPAATRPAAQGNPYEENAYHLAEGKRLYVAYNCKGCHARGGGDIGPPLMDDKWIYGHEPEQVFSTIVQGRPNGMPAFGTKIPEYQAWQLAAYVRSMSGQVSPTAAPSRNDHMKANPPENTIDPEQPKDAATPKSAERPQ
jgi:cytochrome c oxidase cbb3-type subunit 3